MDQEENQLGPRQRAAMTKRLRTREACLKAARKLFEEHGWYGTRLEDIAEEAGISIATLHNHFGTKQALIGYVYKDETEAIVKEARQKIADKVDPLEGVKWCVLEMATFARRRRRLLLSLLGGLQEQTIKVDGPPVEEDDVRRLVPLPVPLVELLLYGQSEGVFSAAFKAPDVGIYHTNAMMMRVMTRAAETADETANLVLSQLVPFLRSPDGS